MFHSTAPDRRILNPNRESRGWHEEYRPLSDFHLTVHHLRNGEKLIAFGFIPRNQMICSDHGICAVRSHLLVSAIMQQDHVAAANLFCNLALDNVSTRR